MKFSILVLGAPYSSQCAYSAYKFTEALLNSRHQIGRVFFYKDAVHTGTALATPPTDEFNLYHAWQGLKDSYDVELMVCIAAAARRGNCQLRSTHYLWCLTMMQGKQLLVICSKGLAGSHFHEALDLALAASAFDLDVGLFFTGEGIYNLLDNLSPESIGQKNTSKLLSATPIYGIEQIYVRQDEISQLDQDKLTKAINIESLNPQQLKQMIRNSRAVIRL